MLNTTAGNTETGETPPGKAEPDHIKSNPQSVPERMAGSPLVYYTLIGSGSVGTVAIILIVLGSSQHIPILIWTGLGMLGIATVTWTILFGALTTWTILRASRSTRRWLRTRRTSRENRRKEPVEE